MIHARCVGDGFTACNTFLHRCIHNIPVEVGTNLYECVHKGFSVTCQARDGQLNALNTQERRCITVSNYPKLNNINIYIRECSHSFAEEL